MQLISSSRRGARRRASASLAAAGVLAVAATAAADGKFESKIQVYADDDHTQVVSPVVSAEAALDDATTVNAGYLVDAVSSASIDVVSQASPITIHDLRHQVSLGGVHTWNQLAFRLGYTFSGENDYRSHGVGIGLTWELFEKNTALAASYALSVDTVGRAHDANFARDLDVHRLSLAWTQVVSRRATTQIGYELNLARGYQASAYRFVPVQPMSGAAPDLWVAETDPEDRDRQALVVGANWFIPRDSALQGDYRVYRDTWGITSHTFGLRYFVNLSENLELRLRSRLYRQSGASFYRPRYEAVERYMTVDRELSPLWSETLGAKLMVALSERLEGELKLDGFYYHYDEFPLLTSRTGVNAGVGLTLTY